MTMCNYSYTVTPHTNEIITYAMSAASMHWGGIPVAPSSSVENVTASVQGKQPIMEALEVEGARLHQPSSKHSFTSTGDSPVIFGLDAVTEHTLKLMEYAHKLGAAIAATQQGTVQDESDSVYGIHQSMPHISEFPNSNNQKRKGDLDSEKQSESTTLRKLLRKYVAGITAQVGYSSTTESVLDTLMDVCQEYLTQMTQALARAVEREALTGFTGFPDVLERVFHEMGMGSMRNLQGFYRCRVLGQQDNMTKTCTRLLEQSNEIQASQPDHGQVGEAWRLTRIKDEPVADIQFPASEDSAEETSDQSENLQSLDGLGNIETTIEHETPTAMQDPPVVKEEVMEGAAEEEKVTTHNIISIKQEEPSGRTLDVDEDLLSIADSVGVSLVEPEHQQPLTHALQNQHQQYNQQQQYHQQQQQHFPQQQQQQHHQQQQEQQQQDNQLLSMPDLLGQPSTATRPHPIAKKRRRM
ncbi:PREDICTED: STAGA complex 65 subunit gamma-like isoform X2 [Priapulus caudatus]|uniref:STAGA complex 65 subunit gamma-like isoform X2 n=1 Tax=Priapulus caudatus TaxID=37621 RepID=A0ABM1E4N2_PRICU|nr:PREDICTED: STAGA complex 65 subunit gamma-like isoform X2 [Priapulus caudatus]